MSSYIDSVFWSSKFIYKWLRYRVEIYFFKSFCVVFACFDFCIRPYWLFILFYFYFFSTIFACPFNMSTICTLIFDYQTIFISTQCKMLSRNLPIAFYLYIITFSSSDFYIFISWFDSKFFITMRNDIYISLFGNL